MTSVRSGQCMILSAGWYKLLVVRPFRRNQEQEPSTMDQTRKYVAEAIGTFWLTFGGCGSAVIAAAFPEIGIGLLAGATHETLSLRLGPAWSLRLLAQGQVV